MDLDARHASAHPELELVTFVTNLLALEELDFDKYGQEGHESFLIRLLFALWGPAKVSTLIAEGEDRIGQSLTTASQRDRFATLIPDS